MNSSPVQAQWQAVLVRDGEHYAKEALKDPLANWDTLARPHGKVEFELSPAIDTACADLSHPLVETFAQRALRAGERALTDPRWQGDWGEVRFGYPYSRAIVLRDLNYARWIAAGTPLNPSDFAAASQLAEQATADTEDWNDEVRQSRYLIAVNLALVAGDIARAEALLKARKRMTYERQWQVALQAAVAARSSTDEADRAPLLARFDVFFNGIRTPKPTTTDDPIADLSLLRLEMGVLRHAYFFAGELPTDWRAIVRMISA